MKPNYIKNAAAIVGRSTLAKLCGVSYQAFVKWENNGKLPRTEWTHETSYAEIISEATNGEVSKFNLVPERYPDER